MPETPYESEVTKRLGQFNATHRGDGLQLTGTEKEMRHNRRVNLKKQAAAGGGSGAGVQFATGRPRDPLFYWKQNNLPYDFNEADHLRRIREYCNTPDAPILMADGTYKPIGEIQVGDKVLGWVWEDGGKRPRKDGTKGRRKRLTSSTVLATSRRIAPEVIETTMESGQIIRCTPDHKWANYAYTPGSIGWGSNAEFRTLFDHTPKSRGAAKIVRYAMPVQPLTDPAQVAAAGYLSGIIDADGTDASGGIVIAQSLRANAEICERIQECLDILEIDHKVSDQPKSGMRFWRLKGNAQNRINLLAWMPLSVKVRKSWQNSAGRVWTGGYDRPVSFTSLGPGEVVSMQTETGNYIAWGLASKNCSLLYSSHPIIASCIDIYSKYPLLGMSLTSKDSQLEDFYSDLFFSEEGLNYDEFTVDMGRQYWTLGEAWPFGSFNESLGIWEDEELLNPNDIEVERSPFLREPRFLIRLPQSLRDIIQNRSPVWEYQKLVQSYPELLTYRGQDDLLPVSSILLRQYKFKGADFSKRGVPILMRAMRSVMQEEMLNSAMDAIADRLYTPLILVKLGASATDLGTKTPWIPTEDDLESFNESLDVAMAADFRVLTHHFGIQMESVFGRENMPDFTNDFERLEGRILQTFGLSKTMLSGACLTGDTKLHLRRAGKGFEMDLETAMHRFNGTDAHLPGRRWRSDIETFIARAEGTTARMAKVKEIWCSGVKEVFRLTTESGKSIEASATHPFLTESGEWVVLGDLKVGDRVQVNTKREVSFAKSTPRRTKSIFTKFHPNQVSNGSDSTHGQRWKCLEHRLVVEADMNGLSMDEFVKILRTDEVRSAQLQYLPTSLHVHHKDHDHRNNALENLEILTEQEHLRHHATSGHGDHVLWRIGSEEIISIESQGEKMTYDVAVEDDPHNFLANDFVVHNSAGETYAADALNRDLVSQLLTSYQKMIASHYRQRALVVAEAQEHYDYDERNGQRYVKMEEVLEVDEETGEERIVEQPKLLIPEISFQSMNLKDEEGERQFLEAMNAAGVPISIKTRMTNIPFEFDDEIDRVRNERVQLAVAEQETRKAQYIALRDAKLPIPQDLLMDFQPKASQPPMPATDGRTPILGLDSTTDLPNMAPTEGDMQIPVAGVEVPGMGAQPVDPQQAAAMAAQMQIPPNVPEESNEMRAGMPKPASLYEQASRMRKITEEHYRQPPATIELSGADGSTVEVPSGEPTGKFAAPRHVGMRRHATHVRDVLRNQPMDQWSAQSKYEYEPVEPTSETDQEASA